MGMKKVIKSLLPKSLLAKIQRIKAQRRNARWDKLSSRELFGEIYQKGLWGRSPDPEQPFFSGDGSHNKTIVSTYVKSVLAAIQSLPTKPNVVDLGCGDFSVGSQIRPFCARYIAGDVVPELIEFNKKKYRSLDVDFRVLDLVADELPDGDVAFIRQVLQHLPNRHIARLVPKLNQHFTYLVLTEHLPQSRDFVPNLDNKGPDIRLNVNSGVVLTEPPFSLNVVQERVLCEVADAAYGGIIRTTMYQLRSHQE